MVSKILEKKLHIKYNHKYIYNLNDNIKIDNNTKIFYKCPIHGEVSQNIITHLYREGTGCEQCGIEKRALSKIEASSKNFLNKANKKHQNKYNYSKSIYSKSYIKMIIECPVHGEFKMTPNCHLGDRGSGCPKCANLIRIDNFKVKKHTQKNILEIANLIHNNKYDYTNLIYKTMSDKYNIICPEHGSFYQALKDHVYQQQGCPKCKRSKGEEYISKLLEEHAIIFKEQKTFKGCFDKQLLKFDFYLNNLNILIEFDGEQHSRPIKYFGGEEGFKNIKRRDNIKNRYCLDNNIRLIRISYNEDIKSKLKGII